MKCWRPGEDKDLQLEPNGASRRGQRRSGYLLHPCGEHTGVVAWALDREGPWFEQLV